MRRFISIMLLSVMLFCLISGATAEEKNGTTWFVLVDYGREMHFVSTPLLTKTQDRMLQNMSDLIGNNDDGALVLCNKHPSILVKGSRQLQNDLSSEPGITDPEALPNALEQIMLYIDEHRDELKAKVTVVVLTTGYHATSTYMSQVEYTLSKYKNYTTYMICAAGSVKTYGSKPDGWRDRATQLADMGALTMGGAGLVTDLLNNDEADRAIQFVRELERSR